MSVVGCIMHFPHDIFSSEIAHNIIGPIFPIDETVAEHLKLIWYPFLIAGIVLAIMKKDWAYFGGFTIGGIFAVIFTLGFFVFYQSFSGTSILWLDIVFFFVVVFIFGSLAFDLKKLSIVKKWWPVWLILAIGGSAFLIVITYLPGNGYIFKSDSQLEKIAEL